MVHLKYFQKRPNVGDKYSLVLAEHYFSKNIIPCDESPLKKPNLLLVGSILHWCDTMSHVCGTGIVAPNYVMNFVPQFINSIRGPLTSLYLQKLGIVHSKIFGDPGIFVPKIFPITQSISHKIGIIPHYVDSSLPWIELCRNNCIPILDVFAPLRIFLEQLQQCEVILSSSLHGLIFAHAYGKPALWIELSDRVIGSGFKFFDYYLSMGISLDKIAPIRILNNTSPYEIAKLAARGNHSMLLPSLEEAMYKTRQQLIR